MNPWFIIWLLFAHWLADFVLQTDEMATNKSSSNLWLTAHVLTYAFILLAAVGVVRPPIHLHAFDIACWVLLNGALHWATDWCTSRWTARLWKAERRHDFFVVIGFDQLLHAATLITTAHFIL